jgi:hypothetical protein
MKEAFRFYAGRLDPTPKPSTTYNGKLLKIGI